MNRARCAFRLLLLAAAIPFAASAAGAELPCKGKLAPESKRSAILEQKEESYIFIARASGAALERVKLKHEAVPGAPKPSAFGIIDGVAVRLHVADLPSICSDTEVQQLWYLHPILAESYVRVLGGLQHTYESLPPPSVVNMSLGPPVDALPIAGDLTEPMNQATRRLAERGLVPIIAIGNKTFDGASPGPNPWCYPDWVICVGAASRDARSVWSGSVEGDPADRRTWPDVVAAGIDIVGPWPTHIPKSDTRRRRDESSAIFLAAVPPAKRDLYTLETGTSQAAPHVSRAAGQIIHFIKALAEDKGFGPGDDMFSLEMPLDRFEAAARVGPRLTGRITKRTATTVEVRYALDQPWKLVKQLLIDTAIPMASYPPHVAGAGFVDPSYVEQQFGAYGIANFQIMPVKVF